MHALLPPQAKAAVERAFNAEFSRQPASRGHAAPVPVNDVVPGQSFVRDSDPDRLLVRAYASSDIREHSALNARFRYVCVVVIATSQFDNGRRVGEVFYMPTHETVRLVDVVSPLKAEAR